MLKYIIYALKGVAMGVANVIPGVSGGTIALITGVFERLINSIKSFNITALKLLFKGKIKAFIEHTDLKFLIAIFVGVLIAIVSLAKLFDYMFTNYPVYIWSYFFGLVLASVYFVGRTINKWNFYVVFFLILGTAVAVFVSFLNPAAPNDGFVYLILCGVVAICSMILPGLSGSFVLILMGNYQLVAIDAINDRDWRTLLPVAIGAAGGLLAFSHLLSWVFKKFRNQTIALLTGFILGSVSILWPWQKELHLKNPLSGELIIKDGEKVVAGYEKFIPETFSTEVFLAIAVILAGVASLWLVEKVAQSKDKTA